MANTYTNDRKIDQMTLKYTNIFQCKIYPNWYFWFENMPSGNPAINIESQHLSTTFSRQSTSDFFPKKMLPDIFSFCLTNKMLDAKGQKCILSMLKKEVTQLVLS
jgi:hypothetical protein